VATDFPNRKGAIVNRFLASLILTFVLTAATAKAQAPGTIIVDGTTYPATSQGIQSAVNACGSSSSCGGVYLPPGIYKISSPVTPKSNVSIFGAGKGNTILQGGAPYGADFLYSSATPLTNVTISDLTIDLQNTSLASGIQLSNVSGSTIRNVAFTNGDAQGWLLMFGAVGDPATAPVQNFHNAVNNVDFSNHAGSLEAFLIFNSQYTTISNVTLRNVTSPGIGLWQKDYDTQILGASCSDSPTRDGVVYYSITVERTTIADLQTNNCGPAIKGANVSDYGTFGLTQAQNLTISNPVIVGGPNSQQYPAIQLGAVNNALVQNPQISFYQIGILLNNANGLSASTNWTITGGTIRDNNASNNYDFLHPGILIQVSGGTGVIQGVQIYDDQTTHTQTHPVIFDGAASFNNISITGNMLSAFNGAPSVRMSSGARVGANFTVSCNTNYVGSNPPQTSTSCP
jgi:hypothetical protein